MTNSLEITGNHFLTDQILHSILYCYLFCFVEEHPDKIGSISYSRLEIATINIILFIFHCFLLLHLHRSFPRFPYKGKGNKKGNMTEKTSQITATYACYPYFIYFSIFLLLLLPFIESPVKSILPLGNKISNSKVTSSILLLKWYLQLHLLWYFDKPIAIRFVGDFLRRTGTHPATLFTIFSKVHCPIAHYPVAHRVVHNITNLL